MTYFHRCPSTIIGAKAFHCPVREGKEWCHLAMVVRRRVWRSRFGSTSPYREEAWFNESRFGLVGPGCGVALYDCFVLLCILAHLAITFKVIGSSRTGN